MIDVNAYLGHFAFRRLRNTTAEGLLRVIDSRLIEKAVVSSASSITYRNPQAGNEEIHEQVHDRRDRFIPFAVLNPAYAGWREDLKICHEQFGMRGLRLYPNWHGYKLTGAACLELVNAAAERKMAVSIPQRVEDRRQQSWLVDVPDVNHDEMAALFRAVPKASFLIVNGSGFAGSILARKGSSLPSNYVIDISLLRAELDNEIGQLVDSLGEDRVVFGTGMPFHVIDAALAKLEILAVPEAVKEKIRHANAARILG